jgi:hypothetical protein
VLRDRRLWLDHSSLLAALCPLRSDCHQIRRRGKLSRRANRVLTRRSRSCPCSFAWPRKRTKGQPSRLSPLCAPQASPLFPQASTQHFFVLAWPQAVDRIATIKCQFGYTRSDHEFAMAGAVKVLGLVKSARVVVVSVDARERHQYRGLVLAVPPPAETADRQHVRRRADAPSLHMSLAAHSDRSFRARMFSGSACSTPGCRAS